MAEAQVIERLASEVAALRSAVELLTRARGDRLTRAEVCERLGVHRNTLRTYIERGFPGPGRDGKWLLADVMAWEARRA